MTLILVDSFFSPNSIFYICLLPCFYLLDLGPLGKLAFIAHVGLDECEPKMQLVVVALNVSVVCVGLCTSNLILIVFNYYNLNMQEIPIEPQT